MSTAVVGLVGVIVGAGLAGLTQWLMVRRTDRIAARTAARVVRYELRQYQGLLRFQIQNQRWDVRYWFSPVRWRELQATIAGACTSDEWSAVEMAYDGVEIVDSWHRQLPGSNEPPNVAEDPQQSGMPTVLTNVEAGMHALERLADVPANSA